MNNSLDLDPFEGIDPRTMLPILQDFKKERQMALGKPPVSTFTTINIDDTDEN